MFIWLFRFTGTRIYLLMTNCHRTLFNSSIWFLSTFHFFSRSNIEDFKNELIKWSINNIKWKTSHPTFYTRVTSSMAVTDQLGSALKEMKLSSILFQTTQPFLMCLGYIFHALVYFYSQLCYFGYHWILFLLTYSDVSDNQIKNLDKTEIMIFLECCP